MSNLGGYQLFTTLAKKVGGPRNLIMMIVGGTAVLTLVVEHGGSRLIEEVRTRRKSSRPTTSEAGETFTVHSAFKLADDVELSAGSRFCVLEQDNDTVLVTVLDRQDNPFFASRKTLAAHSDLPR